MSEPLSREDEHHEQNLRDLKLIREDPGWALSRVQESRRLEARVQELEREKEATDATLKAVSEDLVVTRQEETCLICGQLWRRHDPEDGMCDAPADGELGACKCGRDIAWMRYKISKLSHRALTDGRP